ncbi:hypothetical protein M9Y10_015806 [Tritrichomonas musculus]|uniref:Protein kinase domain-containing protein n=1 Tax=Tritrichomonas musculus TaxID=1915356 RepID=A0ABR2I5C2_9EUKA
MNIPSSNFLDLSKFEMQQKIKTDVLFDTYIVKKTNSNDFYFAKISHNDVTNDTPVSNLSILHESNILSKITHPSIIKLIGFSPQDFEHNKKHVMVTEYNSNGSLKQQHFGEISDTQKLIILFGIAAGMHYLQSNKIIFRNLNAENILLDDKFYPKICGFQLADKYKNSPYLASIEGKPIYIAPEIWEKGEYSEASDVYAFSMIAYQLFTGQIPFQKLNINEIYENVKNNKRPEIESFNIPKSYKKLIQMCWSQNINQRPSFEQIVNQLKTNESYLTKSVNTKEFLQYVDFIEKSEIKFNADK